MQYGALCRIVLIMGLGKVSFVLVEYLNPTNTTIMIIVDPFDYSPNLAII